MSDRPGNNIKRAVIVLTEGFEETEAIGPCDVLRRGGVEVVLATIDDKMGVVGSHGIEIKAEMRLQKEVLSECGMLVLPGGMPGSKRLYDSAVVVGAVQAVAGRGDVVGAICAAPSVLGKAGVLAGKRATCFPGFEDKLDKAVFTGARVEVDGNVVTANGAGAAYEFGLALLAKMRGQGKADEVRRQMMLP